MDSNTCIKKQIVVFMVMTFILSAIAFFIVQQFDSLEAVILYMICPGLSAIATKLIFKQPLTSFPLSFQKPKFFAVAYFLPLIYIAPAYFFVWVSFDNFPNSSYLNELMSAMPNLTEMHALLIIIGTSATIGVVGTAITGALGEELGWRGFLVPKLLESNSFNKTSIIVGFIWLVWHLPIILYTEYFNGVNLYFGLACFSILVISLSFLLTWLQIKSDSIWPTCILHASHNVFLQQIFSPLTVDSEISQYFTGEFGIGVAVSSALITIIVVKRKKTDVAIHVDEINP